MFLTDLVESLITSFDIKNESAKDPIISRVIDYVLFAWSTEKNLSLAFDRYKNRKVELSIDQGSLIWGSHVIIPKALQPHVLESLHEAHPGMSQTKSLARSNFWWVKMDKVIDKRVKMCESCQKHQSVPASAWVHPW